MRSPDDLLLDPQAGASVQAEACAVFHADCLSRLPPLADAATTLSSGRALSPADAARCVLDGRRTALLLQALDHSIAARLRAAPSATVRVLYAGCGPLAPLALLLAPRYRQQPVRFTLVDIHPRAIAAAQHLFAAADAAHMLSAPIAADAATLRLPAAAAPNVLVAELMQCALQHEPQVAVLANLWPQCAADAVLVPASVSVRASLGRMQEGMRVTSASQRIELAVLLELSAATLPEIATALANGAETLAEQTLQVPATVPPGMHLVLRTRIETMPGRVLDDGDSGLTQPHWHLALGAVVAGERLHVRYRMGPDPGFEVQRLQPDFENIVWFLRAIGIEVVATPLPAETLLPGVAIRHGVLHYDPRALTWPGDLLHEAGHLAVTPAALRPAIDGDALSDAPHAGEAEATAWAYAALHSLGLDPAVLFHGGGYAGKGERLAYTYAAGCYPGAGGLIAAGMCDAPSSASGYPRMRRWLRE